MTIAYITNYNLNKITSNVTDVKIDDCLLNEVIPLIDELKVYFSIIELSKFFLINDIINNSGEIIIKYLKKYKKTNIDGSAYHTSADCVELNKNYLDVRWDRGYECRDEFKNFERDLRKIYENIIYGDINDNMIDLVVPNELKHKYGAHDAKVTIIRNSGHLPFSNLSKSEIIVSIKSILSKAYEFKHSSEEIKETIERYTYGTDRRSTIKKSHVMQDWKNYKDNIVELIIAYFRVSSTHNVDSNFLESLNLKQCKSCASKTKPLNYGNPFEKLDDCPF